LLPIPDIGSLSATRLAARLQARELRALDVVEACLARIAARDPEILAWTAIDADYARRQAHALDSGPIRGPLHGIPIGVKDIMDTAALPTGYGSPIYAGHQPDSDAACVTAALAAGAVVLGKTASTEFACQSPPATVNPRNPAHTPGGSSSGSAAAIADGMVPLAFGTQTAGSIIRPASYCGVVGYKPTFGTIEREGTKLVAQSLDTIGALARTVADAALLVGVIAGRPDIANLQPAPDKLRIGFCRTSDWTAVASDSAVLLESAVARLVAAGARMTSVELPSRYAGLGDAHAAIQGYEAVRNLAAELAAHRRQLTPPLLAMLDEGSMVSAARYEESLRLVRACRRELANVMGDCQVLLGASATSEAPEGLEFTGSPVMNRTWTALHVPCVNVPAARGPKGLPVGAQIIGRVGDDARTLAAADWIQRQLQQA